MPEKLINFMQFIPFVLLTTEGIKINKARVIETLFAAAIIAIITSFITIREMKIAFDIEFKNIYKQMECIKEISDIMHRHETRLGIVEVRQNERLERERKTKGGY